MNEICGILSAENDEGPVPMEAATRPSNPPLPSRGNDMARNMILMAFALFLIGCATAYGPQSYMGGFSETQLTPNAWQVRFVGNGYTSSERASDFALLRTAELMLESGFKYFVVLDSANQAQAYTFTTPQTATTTLNANTNVFGNTATTTGTATTNTYGGQTYTHYKPRSTVVAIGTNAPVSDGSLIFDAQFLVDTLTRKHDIQIQRLQEKQ